LLLVVCWRCWRCCVCELRPWEIIISQ
jgi:hypothetical protein